MTLNGTEGSEKIHGVIRRDIERSGGVWSSLNCLNGNLIGLKDLEAYGEI